MGEHGLVWENMESMENTNQISLKKLDLWFKTLYSLLKTLYLSTKWGWKPFSPSFSEIHDFLPMILKMYYGKIHQIHDSKNEILHLETWCLWNLQKHWLNLPFHGLQSDRYNLHSIIGGHHCQLDNQCN